MASPSKEIDKPRLRRETPAAGVFPWFLSPRIGLPTSKRGPCRTSANAENRPKVRPAHLTQERASAPVGWWERCGGALRLCGWCEIRRVMDLGRVRSQTCGIRSPSRSRPSGHAQRDAYGGSVGGLTAPTVRPTYPFASLGEGKVRPSPSASAKCKWQSKATGLRHSCYGETVVGSQPSVGSRLALYSPPGKRTLRKCSSDCARCWTSIDYNTQGRTIRWVFAGQ